MLKIKYHWIYEWCEINAVIIGHEKSFVCTQYSVSSKKDNSKSKSSKEINLYFTKLTQCQHLGTVYILRFWKEFWLI